MLNLKVLYRDPNDRAGDAKWETTAYSILRAKLVASQLSNNGCYDITFVGVAPKRKKVLDNFRKYDTISL